MNGKSNKLKKILAFTNSWTGTVVIVLFTVFFIGQAFVIPSGSMKRSYIIGDFLLVNKLSYGLVIPHLPIIELRLLPDFFNNGHLIPGPRPQRGDITVFRFPNNPKIHFIKRTVAVGGDQLFLSDKVLYLRPHQGDEFIKANYDKEQIINIDEQLWVKDPYRKEHPGITLDDNIKKNEPSLLTVQGIVYEKIHPRESFDFGPIIVPDDEFFMLGDNRDYSNDSRWWGTVPYKYIVGKPWLTYLSWENRSYEQVLQGGKSSSLLGDIDISIDQIDLRKICKDIDINSQTCKTKWEDNRYKIRFERMFKTAEGLEELVYKY